MSIPLFFGAATMPAATYTWDGGGGNDNWSTAANWDAAIVSVNALVFAGTTRLTPNNDVSNFSATTVVFNNTAGAFTIGGNAFNISTSLTNNDADTQTINNSLTISASQSWNAASGNLVFGGNIGLSTTGTSRTLTFSGNNASFGATVTGNISNGGTATASRITKTNAGFLTLSGNNTYGGTTTLSGGTLNINSATALGTGAFSISASGVVIDNTSGGAITLTNNNTQTWGGNFTFTGSNDLNLGTGNVSLGAAGRTVTVTAGNLTAGGVISESSGAQTLTKAGNGTLTLTGANTYSGATTINNGTLSASNLQNGGTASSIGDSSNAAANLILAGSTSVATLKYTGAGVSSNRLFTLGTGTNAGGLDASGSGAINFTNTGSMAFSGAGTRTLTLSGTNTGANTLATVIGDSGGNTAVVKSGTGTWVLSGANTYNGVTTVSGGVLSVVSLKNGGSASNIGDSTNVAGNLVLNGGTLRYTGGSQSTNRLFTLGTGTTAGTIEASGSGALNFTNTGSMAFSGSGTRTLTLAGTNTGANTLAAVIGDNGGATSLIKDGDGQWVLSGTSTFTGSTSVNAGTLNLQSNSALGAGTAGTTVANNATLALQGGVTVGNGTLSLTGTGYGSVGALTNVSGNNTWNGNVTLPASASILSQAGTLTIGSTRPAFDVNGLDLPTESGYVTIGNQTLTFGGAGTGIVVNSRIRDFAGQKESMLYTTTPSPGWTDTPETSSPGNVIVNMTAGGTVTFAANANSYTGTTTVQAGTLILDTAYNIAAPHDLLTRTFHAINGPLVIGNGDATSATVKLGGAFSAPDAIASTSTVTMYKDGILDLNGSDQTIDALAFTGGAIQLNSGNLYLNNNVTVNASAGNTATISGLGQLSLTLKQTAGVDDGAENGTRTFNVVGGVGNTYDLTISSEVVAGNLVKSGSGTMMMNDHNLYQGTTSITGGILNIQNGSDGSDNSPLGLANGTVGQGTSVSSGATLQLQHGSGVTITKEMLTLSGTGFGSLGALNNLTGNNTWGIAGTTYINLADNARINSSANTLTLAGNMSSSGDKALTVGGSGNTTISGSISTGTGSTATVTKDGSGTLVLSGSNAYNGVTNVTEGVVSVEHNSGLGTTTAGTTVTAGAELQLNKAAGLTIGGEELTLNGAGIGGASGALTNFLGNNSFGGNIILNTASTIKSTSGTLTLGGNMTSANNALTITGAGNVTVTGSSIANGTGTLTKTGSGTFTFAGALDGTTGTVGATALNAGAMVVGNGTQTTTLNTGAFSSLAGTTLTIATNGLVVANYASGSTTFAGDLAGSGTFHKTGAGTLVFDHSFSAAGLTLQLSGGGTLSLLAGVDITFDRIHITGDTILDFNGSGAASTFLTSAKLQIESGVTVTINNWYSVANTAALSTIWKVTSQINGGTLGGSDLVETPGAPLSQIDFTGATGLKTTWVSGNHNGWFDHEIRPTPEPATYGALLLSSALALLGWRRWKQARLGQ